MNMNKKKRKKKKTMLAAMKKNQVMNQNRILKNMNLKKIKTVKRKNTIRNQVIPMNMKLSKRRKKKIFKILILVENLNTGVNNTLRI